LIDGLWLLAEDGPVTHPEGCSMSDNPASAFDGYHELVGIAPEEQPPTLYRLLGLTVYESNPKVIERAADRQMAHLRSFQAGPHAAASQQLLNEVSKARRTLLTEEEKAAYDRALKSKTAKPLARAKPLEPVPQSAPVSASPAANVAPIVAPAKRRPKKSPLPLIVGGVATALAVIAGAVWTLSPPPAAPIAQRDPKTTPQVSPPPPVPTVVAPPKVVPPPIKPTPAPSEDPATTSKPLPVDPTIEEPVVEPPADPPTPTPPVVPEDSAPPSAVNLEELKQEIDAARQALREHPKFKKYYDHLESHPESLAANGPKLAALLWSEAQENTVIAEHGPSLVAACEEVERLAAAGKDFKLALEALDARAKHAAAGVSPPDARVAKTKLLVAAAEATIGGKANAQQRADVKAWMQTAIEDASRAGDAAALAPLLTADATLMRSSIERLQAITARQLAVEEALAQDRLAVAEAIVADVDSLLKTTTPGKPRKEATDQNELLHARVAVARAAADVQVKLATTPDDPVANQAVGMHLLVNRGKWKESLGHLAKGTDSSWKELATETLAATDGKTKAALADRWATLETADSAAAKDLARHLYQEAFADPQFLGLARSSAQEKARALGAPKEAVAAPSPRDPVAAKEPDKALPLNKWIELLPLINLDEDVVRGYWYFRDGRLINESVFESRLRVPIDLANVSYDLQVDFDLAKDADDVVLILPLADRSVMIVIDGFEDRQYSFFDRIQGLDANRHPRAFKGQLLEANKSYRMDVGIRLKDKRAHTTVAINGVPRFEYEGPITDFSSPWNVGSVSHLGISTSDTEIAYHACRVRILEGEAHLLRPTTSTPTPDPWAAKFKGLKPIPLTGLKPVSAEAQNNNFGISQGTRNPIVHGQECHEYIFAHAPSKVVYTIPPKAKSFSAIAYAARSPSVKFTVKVDGKSLFECQDRAIVPFVVELPAGAKELELECDPLGNVERDHSCWCFPTFR
jgi:hypothetical protein